MTRRGFLAGLLATSALAVSSPALALTGNTVDFVKNTSGQWEMKYEHAQKMSATRVKLFNQAANRSWNIGTYQGLTPRKQAGLLTKMLRPLAKARGAGGIARALLSTALIAGLQWALSDGSILKSDTSDGTVTREQPDCKSANALPLAPSPITMIETGMYANSSRSAVVAYMKQAVPGWSGGTVPAPSGWSWNYQTTSLGVTQVWFSRQVTSTNCRNFQWPKVPMPELPELVPQKEPMPDDVKRKLPDVWIETAPPLPETGPDGQEEPDNKGLEKGPATVPFPDVLTPGDIAQEWDAPFGDDPWFKFDGEDLTAPGTNPTPTPTPTSSPTPGTGTGTNPGTGSGSGPDLGEQVEPEGDITLPGWDTLKAPFVDLFKPVAGLLDPGRVSCPSIQWPWFGKTWGSYTNITLTQQCAMWGTLPSTIPAVSFAAGGIAGVYVVAKA